MTILSFPAIYSVPQYVSKEIKYEITFEDLQKQVEWEVEYLLHNNPHRAINFYTIQNIIEDLIDEEIIAKIDNLEVENFQELSWNRDPIVDLTRQFQYLFKESTLPNPCCQHYLKLKTNYCAECGTKIH